MKTMVASNTESRVLDLTKKTTAVGAVGGWIGGLLVRKTSIQMRTCHTSLYPRFYNCARKIIQWNFSDMIGIWDYVLAFDLNR